MAERAERSNDARITFKWISGLIMMVEIMFMLMIILKELRVATRPESHVRIPDHCR